MLWSYARGIDDRPLQTYKVNNSSILFIFPALSLIFTVVHQQRKSIGVDANWGIRFTKEEEVLEFIKKLSIELVSRANAKKVRGKTIQFKVCLCNTRRVIKDC